MRKVVNCIIVNVLLASLIFSATVTTFAESGDASGTESTPTVSVTINNKECKFEPEPFIVDGTVMVPFRGVLEALGARVYWNSDTEPILVINNQVLASITISAGSDQATINWRKLPLSQPVQKINATTMVPVRFISDISGAKIEWNEGTRTIFVTNLKPQDLIQQQQHDLPKYNGTIRFGTMPLEFNAKPVVVNNTILADIQPLLKLLGNTSYRSTPTEISGSIGKEFKFVFAANLKTAIINGKEKELPVAPVAIDNHILVPLPFFVDALGYKLEGNATSETITINSYTFEDIINDFRTRDLQQLTYEGERKDGKMNGHGKLFNGEQLWYEGEFSDGDITGAGSLYFKGEVFYKGEVRNRIIQGKGTFYHGNGKVAMEGSFENGRLNGYGQTYQYGSDGEVDLHYVGEFRNGRRNGEGKLYSRGEKLWYEGGWKDGQFHGHGKSYNSNGMLTFDGNWNEHVMSGFGKQYDRHDGTLLYEGNYANDQYDGQGTRYLKNGIKMAGEFRNGEFAKGTVHKKENGEYVEIPQVQEGNGTKFYANGDYYTGEMKGGMADGSGIRYWENGKQKYVGTFAKDQIVNGIYYWKNGLTEVGTYIDGILDRKIDETRLPGYYD